MARPSSLALAVAVLAIICCFTPRSATAIRGDIPADSTPQDHASCGQHMNHRYISAAMATLRYDYEF
ncbi:unnamed protein product [Triticum turgidum subsp. durum]|uniref:Uncharacterized protein n=1 Tax=Triticum turgidum subsp. durum TaxID=4567 RepID=A0A9R1RV99_TRITD|nr:unnamed protein product [Triticum turgidum subsp. durum]